MGDPARGYFAGLPGRLYATVNADAGGHGPVFFTEATSVSWDNRLAALASDRTEYVFELDDPTEPVQVEARLVYRRAWRALVDEKGWTRDGLGRPLEDLEPPHFGHVMASAQRIVDPPSARGGGCATGQGHGDAPRAVLLLAFAWASARLASSPRRRPSAARRNARGRSAAGEP